MKALFLYSDKTGIKKSPFFYDCLIKKLDKYFELTATKTNSVNEFENLCFNAHKNNYEAIIVAGGDGTFNLVCTCVSKLAKEDCPIIGYLPTGTVNDAGKNFGAKTPLKRALKILKEQHVIDYDICKANDSYFTYVAAIGQYSDISYITKRNKKKYFGRLSYYRIAIKEAFKKKIVNVEIEVDGKKEKYVTPFVLILNGKNVGGFPINPHKTCNDGYFDVFLTKPGIFNGLLHYLFFKVKTIHIKTNKIFIHTDQDGPWCLDGEKGISGDLEIECLHSHLRVFGKK